MVETILGLLTVQKVGSINNNLTKVMACLQLLHMIILRPQLPVDLELLHCTAVTVRWVDCQTMDVLGRLNLRKHLKALEPVVHLVEVMMLLVVDPLIKVRLSSITTPSKAPSQTLVTT